MFLILHIAAGAEFVGCHGDEEFDEVITTTMGGSGAAG